MSESWLLTSSTAEYRVRRSAHCSCALVVGSARAPHKSAHNLLLGLCCFPLWSCVTGLLFLFFSSGMVGTRIVSGSWCWCWLRPLLLLLYKELLRRSLTAFPNVLPLRRLVNFPKVEPPILPALPLALWKWWPGSNPVWKWKIKLIIFLKTRGRILCLSYSKPWGPYILLQALKTIYLNFKIKFRTWISVCYLESNRLGNSLLINVFFFSILRLSVMMDFSKTRSLLGLWWTRSLLVSFI